jgi:hypothetical protein
MSAGPLPAHLEAFLRSPRPAVIGYLRSDGAPATVATWFLWLGDGRFLMTLDAKGFRARMLELDGRVALTVLGDDWYDHLSLRGRVVELRSDPDFADVDRVSLAYRGVPHPRASPFIPVTAVVQVDGWHDFSSTTRS